MQELDYKKLGLKCGIEVHQQINSHKLFCSCPSIIRDDNPDLEIKRQLKAVIGESGEIDAAALHEQKRAKSYHYQGYTDITCLVELDEEPPHMMNQDALNTVLTVSKMLKANIVDEIQIMRKTVVDGSNTTGFQRTALVSRNGFIQTEDGKVHIPTISIEEDACKIVKRTSEYDIYNLSRLGIPLIEIGTDPDIRSPNQAKEAAEKLGMILRSTGKVKRGLGTIRQDVNVSIKGGVRIEIKGAQDLRMMPKLVENEVIRQINLINLSKNKINTSIIKDLTKLLSKTNSNVLRKYLDNKGAIQGIKISDFNGKIKQHIQPGKRLGTELSDYAKSASGVGGLFHSDELPNYGITEEEIKKIKKELSVEKDDAFIIIADNENIVKKALNAVKHRLDNLLVKEVRRANADATTTFLRPMPGAARMYPETDTMPITPDIKNIKLPELINDKIKRFEKEYKISNDLAAQIVKSGINFEEIVLKYNKISPNFIADTLINSAKEIKKRYNKEIDVGHNSNILFDKLSNDEITKEAVFEILVEIAHDKNPDYSKYKPIDKQEIEKEIIEIINKNKGAPFGALMGQVMGKFRGKVDGQIVSELIKKHTK